MTATARLRWRIFGTNLGLDTRSAYAEVGKQGTFRIIVGFDELRSNYTDSYQTPFLGNGIEYADAALELAEADRAAGERHGRQFPRALAHYRARPDHCQRRRDATHRGATGHRQAASSRPTCRRSTISISIRSARSIRTGSGFNIDPRWDVKLSASQTQQNGLKPLNMISLASGTFSAVMPNLIDQTTNQYNASINYTGDKFFFTAAYYGSYFTNNNNSMTFENAVRQGHPRDDEHRPEQRVQPVHAEGRLQLHAHRRSW